MGNHLETIPSYKESTHGQLGMAMFCPDGKHFAIAYNSEVMQLWEMEFELPSEDT